MSATSITPQTTFKSSAVLTSGSGGLTAVFSDLTVKVKFHVIISVITKT